MRFDAEEQDWRGWHIKIADDTGTLVIVLFPTASREAIGPQVHPVTHIRVAERTPPKARPSYILGRDFPWRLYQPTKRAWCVSQSRGRAADANGCLGEPLFVCSEGMAGRTVDVAEMAKNQGRLYMSDHITSETISRRKLLFVLGFGLALAVPTTTLTVSEAEAQTTGMTRRQDRRTGRHERRDDRRTGRTERRDARRTGGTQQ